jgi:hypothetical protein
MRAHPSSVSFAPGTPAAGGGGDPETVLVVLLGGVTFTEVS